MSFKRSLGNLSSLLINCLSSFTYVHTSIGKRSYIWLQKLIIKRSNMAAVEGRSTLHVVPECLLARTEVLVSLLLPEPESSLLRALLSVRPKMADLSPQWTAVKPLFGPRHVMQQAYSGFTSVLFSSYIPDLGTAGWHFTAFYPYFRFIGLDVVQ